MDNIVMRTQSWLGALEDSFLDLAGLVFRESLDTSSECFQLLTAAHATDTQNLH